MLKKQQNLVWRSMVFLLKKQHSGFGSSSDRIGLVSEVMKVAVVGVGTAGPATAVLLAREGHRVSLFDKAPVKEAVGAGFLLQPTGMAVLEQMELLDKLKPATASISKLFCKTASGRVLLDLHYDQLEKGLHGCGTYRPLMLDLLLAAAEEAGVHLLWDCEITELGNNALIDSHNRRHGPFDLIIIADGARSRLRDQLGVPCRVDRYPWGALWFIGRRTPEFAAETLYQNVSGTRLLNGYLPTGTDQDLLSLFWSVHMDELPYLRERPIQKWKDDVLRLSPEAESFLEQIEHWSQLPSAAYYDVRMKRQSADSCVVLGDAAHALSPQLGQGVNLALLDAWELAKCLREAPLETALKDYEISRKRHTKFYQFATRWATPFFQSDYDSLALLRDEAFPIGLKLPWARRQMVATMAGVKTGIFTRSLSH